MSTCSCKVSSKTNSRRLRNLRKTSRPRGPSWWGAARSSGKSKHAGSKRFQPLETDNYCVSAAKQLCGCWQGRSLVQRHLLSTSCNIAKGLVRLGHHILPSGDSSCRWRLPLRPPQKASCNCFMLGMSAERLGCAFMSSAKVDRSGNRRKTRRPLPHLPSPTDLFQTGWARNALPMWRSVSMQPVRLG